MTFRAADFEFEVDPITQWPSRSPGWGAWIGLDEADGSSAFPSGAVGAEVVQLLSDPDHVPTTRLDCSSVAIDLEPLDAGPPARWPGWTWSRNSRDEELLAGCQRKGPDVGWVARKDLVSIVGYVCAERYLAWEVAEKLDALLDTMLAGDVEIATRHFETTTAA